LIVTTHPDFSSPRIAILGGGPGGYEAAMVAASLGAQVTIIERAGLGGSAVLTDVVPSKTLIATADLMTRVAEAGELGVKFDVDGGDFVPVMRADLKHINHRLLNLARSQSRDIHDGLIQQGVRILTGSGRLLDDRTIEVLTAEGTETVEADTILLAVGAHPRELATARPDGDRILNWAQIYDLDELPEDLQSDTDFQPRPRAAGL
jgi:pyruvate/2-oxoglutarate dehydrogenase complex dihydrolipoamide dehydrogenase (E3) component